MSNKTLVVYNLCLSARHDFGLPARDSNDDNRLISGMTEAQKTSLWNETSKLYDDFYDRYGKMDESVERALLDFLRANY